MQHKGEVGQGAPGTRGKQIREALGEGRGSTERVDEGLGCVAAI